MPRSAVRCARPPSLAAPQAHVELGHALGFRHEHTRPEAGACFEDNSWRPLTPYDSSSIMHYPQCNGASNNLQFSARDAQGAAALYGAPGGGGGAPDPEPPPPDSPLWRHPRVLLTGHQSSSPHPGSRPSFQLFLENLGHYLAGRRDLMRSVVKKDMGY